MEYIKIDAL